MIKIQPGMKITLCMTLFFLFSGALLKAQDKTKVIGNKPRHGSSNSTHAVIKGNQLGIKMKAGNKPVELLKLDFGVENSAAEDLKFKVNVYEFNGILSGENFVKQDITGSIPKGKTRVNVDLEKYHIQVKKDLLVSIEWTETVKDASARFAIGVLNGGSYEFADGKWKKIPLFGLDFNMVVKKLK
ncbi:hypothetical protein [Pedobacter westerhofensis]|nr:hypothetical protein [Pedobacter westerhofensis]